MRRCNLNDDDLRILLGDHREKLLVYHGDAIACPNGLSIDEDAAGRGCQIEVAAREDRMSNCLSSVERRAHDTGICIDEHCVIGDPTRERDETPRVMGARERAGSPPRSAASRTRRDPDLVNPQRLSSEVALGMRDTAAGAHDLNVTRVRCSDIALAVFMRHCALPDKGDNLHVDVAVQAKAGTGCNLVVVPNKQRSQRRMGRVAVRRHREMMSRLKPRKLRMVEQVSRSQLQHVNHPPWPDYPARRVYDQRDTG